MEDGGPSATARRVAAHRLGFARVAAGYGDPAAEDALAAGVVDGLTVPAGRMRDYLAARTSFFDRTVTGAIDRGLRQVVVGAAGYDGRSLRYAKPGVRWFEVDHPATQRDKPARLRRLGIGAAAPSLFLLEGVAVYLEPAVLENVLDQFRQVAAPGSRLAISVSVSGPAGASGRARFQAAVAALGEPARSFFTAGEATALLARAGWQVADTATGTATGTGTGTGAQAGTRAERLRSAGLLSATAGPRAAAPVTTAPVTTAPVTTAPVTTARSRFGPEAPGAIRAALEPLATAPEGEPPPLSGAIQPYPDNWRAAVRPPVTLPHYPMVLHRGGYPDGG